jgi:Putative transposase
MLTRATRAIKSCAHSFACELGVGMCRALVYLGRYLYRGVIQEKDILRCENGQVTYRWRDSKTKKTAQRTVSGVEFLRLVLQHVLPKGFRRARNYGFLHPNSKRLIALLRLLVFKLCALPAAKTAQATQTERPKLLCRCCGAAMTIVRRRILPLIAPPSGVNQEGIAAT